MPGLKKRSVNLAGHATSVALEPAFWEVLEKMALARKVSLAGLVSELDKRRGSSLLASFCRLSALAYVQEGPLASARARKPLRAAE